MMAADLLTGRASPERLPVTPTSRPFETPAPQPIALGSAANAGHPAWQNARAPAGNG